MSGTQAIDRAADLVARVVRASGPVTAVELEAETGLARSTVARILTALDRAALLTRDEDGPGGYLPGPLFEQYAARADSRSLLAHLAAPEMESLGAATGETINLGVPVGQTVVQIAQVDSSFLLGSRNWVGVDLPAHTSSLGKVLYAFGAIPVPDTLEALTEHTVTDPRRLRMELESVRTNGWASTVDELEVGLTGVGAPVYQAGHMVAALGLSGPTTRLAGELDRLGAQVCARAEALSARLTNSHERGAA